MKVPMKVPKVKMNMKRQRPDCHTELPYIPIEEQSDYGLWAMMVENCDWGICFKQEERDAAKAEWKKRFPNPSRDSHGVQDYYTSRWMNEAHRIAYGYYLP